MNSSSPDRPLEIVSGVYRFAIERDAERIRALRRYTAFARYDVDQFETVEEIDVDANSAAEARLVAFAALERDFEPGGEIYLVEERFGLYL